MQSTTPTSRTIEQTVYQFAVLTPEAKEKAIETWREQDEFDPYFLLEKWQEKLTALGYDDPKILYSGFYSQGDGACFTATVDYWRYITAHKLEKQFPLLNTEKELAAIKITHSWRHYFAASTTVSWETYGGEKNEQVQIEADNLAKIIEAEREKLGNEIYADLQEQYEDENSDEYITDAIEANEYEFFADGTMYHGGTK